MKLSINLDSQLETSSIGDISNNTTPESHVYSLKSIKLNYKNFEDLNNLAKQDIDLNFPQLEEVKSILIIEICI